MCVCVCVCVCVKEREREGERESFPINTDKYTQPTHSSDRQV